MNCIQGFTDFPCSGGKKGGLDTPRLLPYFRDVITAKEEKVEFILSGSSFHSDAKQSHSLHGHVENRKRYSKGVPSYEQTSLTPVNATAGFWVTPPVTLLFL